MESTHISSLESDLNFKHNFDENIKLWCRYIDDCNDIYHGDILEFLNWFQLLKICFNKFDLDLSWDNDSHKIEINVIIEKEDKFLTFLDLEIFKVDGVIQTREHRKSTSVNKYLCTTSAHPIHTFPGIVKSQMNRLRKLCSGDMEFKDVIKNLELRCLNSGYRKTMVTEILSSSESLTRNLSVVGKPMLNNNSSVRLVTLAGTSYVKKFEDFASRMHTTLGNSNIRIEIVHCTSPFFHSCYFIMVMSVETLIF